MSRFVFDPFELRDIALRHVGKPVAMIAADLEQKLAEKYGELIHRDMPWVITPAGFLMYQVKMLFARPNECLGLMGVPIESTGHTGRHPVTCYDTMLSGVRAISMRASSRPCGKAPGISSSRGPVEAFAAQITATWLKLAWRSRGVQATRPAID